EDVQAAGYQDDWDAWFRDNDLMQLWAAASRPIDQLPRGTDTRDTGGMSTWRSSWIAHDPGYRRQLQLISETVRNLLEYVGTGLVLQLGAGVAGTAAARLIQAGYRAARRGAQTVLLRRVQNSLRVVSQAEAREIAVCYAGRRRNWRQSAPNSQTL